MFNLKKKKMGQRQFVANRDAAVRPFGKESIFHNYYDDPVGTIVNPTEDEYGYLLIPCESGVEVFEKYKSVECSPSSKQIFIFYEKKESKKFNFFGTACRVKMGSERKELMKRLFEKTISISVEDSQQLANSLTNWSKDVTKNSICKLDYDVLEDAVLLELFGTSEITSLLSGILELNNKLADWMNSGVEKMEKWKFTEENYDYNKFYVKPNYNNFQSKNGASGFQNQEVKFKPIIPIPSPNPFYKSSDSNEAFKMYKQLTDDFTDIALDVSAVVVKATPNVIDDMIYATIRVLKEMIEQKVAAKFGGVFQKLQGTLEQGLNFLQKIKDQVVELASELAAILNAFLCGLINGVVSLLQTVLSILAFIVDNISILELENLSLEKIAKHQEKLEFVEDFADMIFNNAKQLFEGMISFVTNLTIWKEMASFVEIVAKKFTAYNKYFWAFFIGGVLFELILDAVIAFFTGGTSVAVKIGSKISRLASKLDDLASKGIKFGKNLARNVADSSSSLLKWLRKEFEELVEAIKSGDFIAWLKNKFSKLIGESVTKLARYEINILVRNATKNLHAKKVMLGKYVEDSLESYNKRAGNEFTFFELEDKLWKETFEKVNFDFDEMWKINKQFIDEQFKRGKEIYLSHEPTYDKSFFAREIDYLEKDLKGKITKISETLWKVEW